MIADALSRSILLLNTMDNEVLGFKEIKNMYESDANFDNIMK